MLNGSTAQTIAGQKEKDELALYKFHNALLMEVSPKIDVNDTRKGCEVWDDEEKTQSIETLRSLLANRRKQFVDSCNKSTVANTKAKAKAKAKL